MPSRPPNARAKRPDQRSAQAARYRHLYKTPTWRAIRAAQLSSHPFCERCEKAGFTVGATICDHVDPTTKTEATFFDGPFASLCKPCHDGPKQADERAGRPTHRVGYSNAARHDGTPTDPRHPFYAGG